jgi:RND family efflux transporter MFP subunit
MAGGDSPARMLQSFRSEFLPYLESCRDPEQLTAILERAARLVGADGAILWRWEEERLTALALDGPVPPDWARNFSAQSAGAEAVRGATQIQAAREDLAAQPAYAQGQFEQVVSFPLRGARAASGAIELWWVDAPPAGASEVLPLLEEALNANLLPLVEYEAERRNYVAAITRLMMLYDIGKVFHSTLELDPLAHHIAARVQNILEADEAAVWLLDPVQKNLYCPASSGSMAGEFAGTRIWASDPGLGAAASGGEATVLNNVDDPAWTERWGTPIRTLAAVPLMQGEQFLGAIEALRRGGHTFTEEDLRLLMDVAKQASVALRNAQRLQAERRVKELNALMEISKEITGTLDLDRVLSTTVNRLTSVIPADRCSVALLHKGQWQVSAISGVAKVDRKDAAVPPLEAMHAWLAGSGGDVHATQTAQGLVTDKEETREKFATYFEQSGKRSFTGLLLKDEEGVVGTLLLESKEAEALTTSHNDLARIFASQATVALRNALLYSHMPLVGVLQPLVAKKEKFEALPALRRRITLAAAAVALGFLVFFPIWSKPAGDARVLPERVLAVSAEVDGAVRHVLAREGQRVEAGEVLAEIAPEEHRVALERARSERDILNRRVLQLEAQGSLGEARLERARLEEATATLELQSQRLNWTKVRSPISGVMITPRLEEREGQYLKRGDVLCQVVSLDKAWVEVAVPELDIGPIQPGQEAWIKLNTFPDRKFTGQVVRISPQGREQNFARVFDVVVEIPNPDGAIRAGMMGRGKVLAEQVSLGYLVLRPPLRWAWLKIWPLLP